MTPKIPYTLSDHAMRRLLERDIKEEWIERTLLSPDLLELDSEDSTKRHAFKIIPEYGDRVLHVIYNESCYPWRIVSFYFDRKRKRTL